MLIKAEKMGKAGFFEENLRQETGTIFAQRGALTRRRMMCDSSIAFIVYKERKSCRKSGGGADVIEEKCVDQARGQECEKLDCPFFPPDEK